MKGFKSALHGVTCILKQALPHGTEDGQFRTTASVQEPIL